MNKIKILVTSSSFPRWENDLYGNFVYELTKRLTNDFEIFVLCPHAKGVKVYEEIDNLKIYRYKYLPFGLGTLAYDGSIMPKLKKNKLYYLQIPFFLLFQLLAIRKIIKTKNIDIIHSHWIIPQGFIAAMIKKLYGLPFVVTSHGSDIMGLKKLYSIKRFTLKNATKITVVSNEIKKEILQNIDPSLNIDVIPMGVDTKLFNPNKKDDSIKKKYDIQGPFLLFVGRLAPEKGIKYLIEAMPEVINKYPLIKLLIVGDGILRKDLESMTRRLGIGKNVNFLGRINHEDLPIYFATTDIFILPSLREGFGLVLVEAMCCGAIVIATDLPVIKESIKNNEAGFIVKQKNPREISDKIIVLLNDKDKLDKVKIKAKNYTIQNFDWEVIAGKYIELIKSM